MLLVSIGDIVSSLLFFIVLIYVVSFVIFYVYSKVFKDDFDNVEYLQITSIIYMFIMLIYIAVGVILAVFVNVMDLNSSEYIVIISIIGVILYGGLSFYAIYWSLRDTVTFNKERIIITATYVGITIVLLLLNTINVFITE